jgi:riboflavin kinase/FMN adenylyltransferase
LVVTFEPNPAQVLRPEAFTGRLNSPDDKAHRLRAAGAEQVLVFPFTRALSEQTPEQFMAGLQDRTQPIEVWVGEEFALGHNREGTIDRLAAIGRDRGFEVHAVPRREAGGDVVSSSRIRRHILAGEVDAAAALLGYTYRVSGEIVQGAQIGRTIGFPTANVEPPPLLVPVADGIYASRATIEGESQMRDAMTYIGTRPAINTGARMIETHLLDFQGDLYGKILHTDFVKRLRPDANFDSLDALVEQLARDEQNARSVLAGQPLAALPTMASC